MDMLIIFNAFAESLNRNILECKFDELAIIFNVSRRVLIETYWNVNVINISGANTGNTRLNRNILECKYVAN